MAGSRRLGGVVLCALVGCTVLFAGAAEASFVWPGTKITPSVPNPGGSFGSAVAISTDGTTALVGSEYDGLGTAWVFTRSGDTWNQQAELQPIEGAGPFGGFGAGVALSADGNTALVGAANVGKAWVFTRSGTTWTQQGAGFDPDSEVRQGFGRGVALSADGNTALIADDLVEAPGSSCAVVESGRKQAVSYSRTMRSGRSSSAGVSLSPPMETWHL